MNTCTASFNELLSQEIKRSKKLYLSNFNSLKGVCSSNFEADFYELFKSVNL